MEKQNQLEELRAELKMLQSLDGIPAYYLAAVVAKIEELEGAE
jgi:hypothetical protein